jgi:ribosomal protein L32E
VIRVGSNSAAESRGCLPRKNAVIEQKMFKPKEWSRIHRFGYRWRVEGAFSCIKRIFGEYVTAKKFTNMTKELAMKDPSTTSSQPQCRPARPAQRS